MSVFLDDTLSSLIYLDSVHAMLDSNCPSCYNATYTLFDIGLTLIFTGVSVAFYGATGALDMPTEVIIDGQSTTTTIPASPNTINLLYQSPTVSDGQHNITLLINSTTQNALDFMLVKTGSETELTGLHPVMVDDDNTDIVYTGSWTESTNTFNMSGSYSVVPFKGSYHVTTDQQATATFEFAGTSVAVYGYYDETNPPTSGSDVFVLDGASYQIQQNFPSASQPNYLWFSIDSLQPTNHTLVIQNKNPQGISSFSIDYIWFYPIPGGQTPTQTTSGSSTGNLAGATSPASGASTAVSGNGGAHATSGSGSGSSTNDNSGSSTSGTSKSHTVLIGAVVGGIVGGLLFFLLLLKFRRSLFASRGSSRRRDRKTLIEPDEEAPHPAPSAVNAITPYSDSQQALLASSSSIAPSVPAPPTVTSSGTQGTSQSRLIVQGGSVEDEGGMVQIPGPNASVKAKMIEAGVMQDLEENQAGPSHGQIERAQHLQTMMHNLQREIEATGVVVTPERGDGASPPPYEMSSHQGPSV
ncbi:hypothetical protein H0H92_004359 [Tricholoma furcatifolium]|nr:hypothetical protein H0H92_004359 [Tricholoma furcatifolium]